MRHQSRLAGAPAGPEIIIAHRSKVVAELLASECDSLLIGRAAREKNPCHAAGHRAFEVERAIEESAAGRIGGTSKREVV